MGQIGKEREGTRKGRGAVVVANGPSYVQLYKRAVTIVSLILEHCQDQGGNGSPYSTKPHTSNISQKLCGRGASTLPKRVVIPGER